MKIKDGLEVKELNFAEWYLNVLTPQVVLSNSIWHGSFKDLSFEDKAKSIDKQVSVIVMEEMVDEYRKNYGVDMLEELDAICDTLYTMSMLQYMLSVLEETGENEEVDKLINQDQLEICVMYNDVFQRTFMNHFDLDIIIEATQRVVDNNNQKHTDDKEYFDTWVVPKGEDLSKGSRVIDGVEYYFLLNKQGKIRKKEGFGSVVLDDLVTKQIERFSNGESIVEDKDVVDEK